MSCQTAAACAMIVSVVCSSSLCCNVVMSTSWPSQIDPSTYRSTSERPMAPVPDLMKSSSTWTRPNTNNSSDSSSGLSKLTCFSACLFRCPREKDLLMAMAPLRPSAQPFRLHCQFPHGLHTGPEGFRADSRIDCRSVWPWGYSMI